MKKLLNLSIVLFIINYNSAYSQLPESKQASIIETVSSAEILIEATGIYKGIKGAGVFGDSEVDDVKKNGNSRAIDDAKKAAVYLLILGGTDPLISIPLDRQKFDLIQNDFFNSSNITKYIKYEEPEMLKRVTLDGGRGVKVTKRFKVDKEAISKDLIEKNILTALSELTEKIGNPSIMVLPATKKGQNPIELLENSDLKHGSSVIESWLTARKYDVIKPEQQASMQALNDAQMSVAGKEEDISYKLALSIGCDLYVTYEFVFESAGLGTERCAAIVSAFETTTSRALGTETGYSQGRKGEKRTSIEEAMNDAVGKVLQRIVNYWQDDIKKGIQYKIVISIDPSFDEDQAEAVQFTFSDVLEEVAKTTKENIVTKQTLDFLIWCDPAKYDKSSKIYRTVKKKFDNNKELGNLRQININRKMILLKIDAN